ncbi:MAG: hypothetical protein ACYS8X_04955 [Planctomycetota bacterium]|jgi:hypothetical protein
MRRKGRYLLVVLGGLALLAGMSAGCAVKIPIDQYPAFWQEGEIETVAVAPFVTRAGQHPEAGGALADALAAKLTHNGTYPRVIGGSALAALLSQEELQRLSEGDPAIAARLKGEMGIDAVITGAVLRFAAASYDRPVYLDYYDYGGYAVYGSLRHGYYPYRGGLGLGYGHGYGFYGHGHYHRGYWGYYRGGYYGYGAPRYFDYGSYYYGREVGPYYDGDYNYGNYVYTDNRASASATARIMLAGTGETLFAGRSVHRNVASEGDPPRLTAQECLARAASSVSGALVEQFAIVPKVIEVEPARLMRITTGPAADGSWREASDFTMADRQMMVQVDLPPEAAHNLFRLTVQRKGARKVLAEQTFVWRRLKATSRPAFEFNPSQLAATGGGPGEYVVTFHAGGAAVMDKPFTITAPK